MKILFRLVAAIVGILSLSFPAQSKSPIISAVQGGPVEGITIAASPTADYSQSSTVFAANLNTYFVAYRSSLNEILVTRVAPSGAILGSFTVAAARDYYNRGAPRLAYNTIHQELIIVWEDVSTDGSYISNIHGRIFNHTGTPITPNELSISNGVVGAQCFHPSVAYSPVQDRYLVVWQRTSGPDASGNIEGEFVTIGGGLEKFIPIRPAGGNQSFAQPDVAFNHRRNEYLVVFQLVDCNTMPCNLDILGNRVNYLGEVLDGSFGIKIGFLSPPENHPAVAAYPDPNETKCWMVVWTLQFSPDPLDRDIYHNLLNCDGTPQGGLGWALVSTNYDDYDPDIAFNESVQKYLVVWTLTTNAFLNTSSIIGMEINTSGDATGVPKLIGGWYGTQAAVTAGSYGDFLVTYTESVLFGRQQILGSIWGNRVFLPMIRK
jgi:hypothetical protein